MKEQNVQEEQEEETIGIPQTKSREWFTNKDLYLQLAEQRRVLEKLRTEQQATRKVLHNGLLQTVEDLVRWQRDLEGRRSLRAGIGFGIREWTAWAIAVVLFVINVLLLTGTIGGC